MILAFEPRNGYNGRAGEEKLTRPVPEGTDGARKPTLPSPRIELAYLDIRNE
jgi:hypothetical protein